MSEPWSSRNSFFTSMFEARPTLSSTISRRGYSGRPSFYETHDSAMRATWFLIGINASVFGLWQYAEYTKNRNLTQKLYDNATLSPANFREGRYWTMLTSAFSHNQPWHILFNAAAMHGFGRMLSFIPGVGGVHVISLAIGSGIAGSFAWLYQQQSKAEARQDRRFGPYGQSGARVREVALGASGAVMGLGAAATCLMPFAPVNIMFIPIAVPLWIATAGFAAIDTYFLHSETSRVGHSAHLGGAVYGALYYFGFLTRYGGIFRWVASRVGRR